MVTNGKPKQVTFIIPAYNEAKLLPRTLEAVQQHAADLSYEIIVVDNGSTDSTLMIARKFGATVLCDKSRKIGGLRNLGAAHASGDVLVFIDADVLLTKEWAEEFGSLVVDLDSTGRVLTGSRCDVSETPSWLEKYWFKPMTEELGGYINSGHMIAGRKAFADLGGFDDSLATGEDWEICSRAKKSGFLVTKNPKLRVIHEGYPKDLRIFALREIWHGLQDFQNMQSVLASKVALAATVYWFAGVAGILMALYYWSPVWVLSALAFNSVLCLLATLSRRKQYRLSILPNFLIFHVYFYARGLSVIRRLFGKTSPRSRG